jgi:hypothetical protein
MREDKERAVTWWASGPSHDRKKFVVYLRARNSKNHALVSVSITGQYPKSILVSVVYDGRY